jgi:hypothetical protein
MKAVIIHLLTRLVVVLISTILLFGCSTQKDIIRERIIEIPVPELRVDIIEITPVNMDSLLNYYVDSLATDSTYYEAEQVTVKGDSIKAKFYLKDKVTKKPKLELNIKQAPVDYKRIDSTNVVKENKSLTDSLNSIIVYLIIFGVVILAIVYLFKKRFDR